MSGIKLEAGQWYRNRDGEICYCIGNSKAMSDQSDHWFVETETAYCETFHTDGSFLGNTESKRDLIEHLPDCTGFDWEPPKPVVAPEGWEIVEEGVCKKGDRYLFCSGQTGTINIRVGEDVQDAKDARGAVAIIRKIEPKYRPFANAEEFRSFRNEWIKYKQSDTGKTMRCVAFSNEGITACVSFMPYRTAFDSLVFEDGTPFGIRIDD